MADDVYPRPRVSKEEYDRRDLWPVYLDRVHEAIPSESDRQALTHILNYHYECVDYETTLKKLSALAHAVDRSLEVVWPYIRFCRNVCGKVDHHDDIADERTFKRWLSLRNVLPEKLFRFFWSPRPNRIRCKHCGRLTAYIGPNGTPLLGTGNSCLHFKRGYPMPSAVWDSVGGQAYMFYWRSVGDREFYDDMKTYFDVVNTNDEKYGGKPAQGWD